MSRRVTANVNSAFDVNGLNRHRRRGHRNEGRRRDASGLASSGFESHRDVLALRGTREIPEEDVFPGTSSSVYAFTRKTTRRNLYSIPVP